ncbi:phosphoinositide 3-kinase regulatory subunit 6 isoform X1 [Sphaeramia orbicularis]|uniref:phosphoinositide 3-kinase regulatory subunit 6 isoform X1 n=1 Tax=Sphaeramia orbicularis TaxID=375764 RepID=UPI0011802BB8|nr:phosphoinositide 3-kinase regulatory subunit 6-like isoform X1 [Sphaeramia orbicularis]
MADHTDDVAMSSTAESIQALFKETNSQHTTDKAMLRWTLQKTVETHPSCSLLLIRTLVEELQKIKQIHTNQPFVHVIPMLHTLYYAVLQSGAVIPRYLYQTVCECLMKLLILPLPYSAVALSTLKSIKMEMTTPGSLYQRRLIAEQNLKNDHLRLQERVFVLADPAVFSAPLEAAVRADLEASNSLRDTTTQKKRLVLHLLQTGLGSDCQSSKLAQALGALGDQSVEKYFQEAVLAVEQSVKQGAGGCTDYMNKLQHIYTNILAATKEETKSNDDSDYETVLPNPEISFHLWHDEEDLWNLLANFTLRSNSNSSVDTEEKETGDDKMDREDDFGSVKKPSLKKSTSLTSRRNAYKNLKLGNKLKLLREKIEDFPGNTPVLKEELSHTARVMVMGDDRVLGRLAKAFYAIRDKESKRFTLTKKLNLQLYYIPVTNVETSLSSAEEDTLSLASLLGRVDPWYDCNINILQSTIPKLDEMQTNLGGPLKQNFFLLDTLCYYIRCGTRPVNLPLYTVKMIRSSSDVSSKVEEVFVSNLEAHIPEFRHIKEISLKKSSARKKTPSAKIVGGILSVNHIKSYASKRESIKGAVPMTCGLMITSEPDLTSGEDYLTIRYDSVIPGENTEIRTKSISIKTLEHRTLTVCLDKDSRKTYKDIQRIEISPCLDPGCKIQSRFSASSDRELPLSKYLDQVLSLPVNTFTGVTL